MKEIASHTGPCLLLALESSCDETAASVIKDGLTPLSNVVSSQIRIHKEFGGIVPEIASRHHLKALLLVVDTAIRDAGIGLFDVEGLAVTQGPGLVGSLVVTWSFSKALAAVLGIPMAGVNHLHAHLLSVFLEPDPPGFPYVGLVVSGGHTSLFLVRDHLSIKPLGRTRDDAAGEAFDKVATVLGLEYPGGPVVSRLSEEGDPGAISLPRPRLPDTPLDFSFSGLKTAVISVLRKAPRPLSDRFVADLCASFEEAVTDVLTEKTIHAAQMHGVRVVCVTGGVAANRRLREKMGAACLHAGLKVHFPTPFICTDNAAMVGIAGFHLIRAGRTVTPEDDVYSRAANREMGW